MLRPRQVTDHAHVIGCGRAQVSVVVKGAVVGGIPFVAMQDIAVFVVPVPVGQLIDGQLVLVDPE